MPESPAQQDADATVRRRSLANVGLVLALFGATVLAYWPALHGGPLIDDPDHITRPEWRSLAGLARLWYDVGITSQYFPLLHSTFWMEYHLWQDAVTGYHLVNVLQHALSAILVVALTRRLALPGAWLAGFVFALHPVCVDSVAWMSEQKNTLSTLFCLAAAWVYLDYDQTRLPGRYRLASILFVAALLTKSITATLVPALLVIFWWQRGRLGWRREVRPLAPWILLGAAQGLFTAWYERVFAHAQGATFDLSPLERGLIAGRAMVFYLRTLAWPSDLMFVNPRWEVNAAAGWQYLFPAAIVGIAGLLAWLTRWRRDPLAAFLVYAGALAPTLGFLNINWFNYSFVADHFQYLASIGLIIPGAAALTMLARRLGAARAPLAAAAAGALLVVVLGALTWRQSADYRDGETLYRRTIARNPSCWIAHHNLGAILLDRPGGLEEAVAHFVAVLSLKPNHLNAHTNLGHALSRIPGRQPEAMRAYAGALRLNPQAWQAHAGMARLLAANPESLPAAIAEFEAAIKLQPEVASLYHELGCCHVSAGQTAEAVAAFGTAVRLQPGLAPAQYNLACLLSDQPGRLPEAVDHFEAALRFVPNDPAVHNNLGLALLQLGRRGEAIRHLQTGLQLAPDSAEGHFSLGRALLTEPADPRAALRQFEIAARLRPDWAAAQKAVAQLRARPNG